MKTAESIGQTEARVGFSKQTKKKERKKENKIRKKKRVELEAVKHTPWTISIYKYIIFIVKSNLGQLYIVIRLIGRSTVNINDYFKQVLHTARPIFKFNKYDSKMFHFFDFQHPLVLEKVEVENLI